MWSTAATAWARRLLSLRLSDCSASPVRFVDGRLLAPPCSQQGIRDRHPKAARRTRYPVLRSAPWMSDLRTLTRAHKPVHPTLPTPVEVPLDAPPSHPAGGRKASPPPPPRSPPCNDSFRRPPSLLQSPLAVLPQHPGAGDGRALAHYGLREACRRQAEQQQKGGEMDGNAKEEGTACRRYEGRISVFGKKGKDGRGGETKL